MVPDIGTTHAAAMAELGHEVIGVDIDEARIARLQTGDVPFYEPGLTELLSKHVKRGMLRFTTSIEEGVVFGNMHFDCVGTPQQAGEYAADVSYVDAAFNALTKHMSAGDFVVGKSTVPLVRRLDWPRWVRQVGAELV